MRALTLTGLIAVAFVLSGCTGTTLPPYHDDCAPPVGARLVELQDVAPELDIPIEITVTAADSGEPLPGANVVIQWVDADGASDPRIGPRPVIDYVALASDADGMVQASVPEDRYVLVAAALPGYTEEWSPLMEPGAINQSIELPLYPSTLSHTFEGVFSGTATPVDSMDVRFPARSILEGQDPSMLSRAYGLTVVLKWQQDATDAIDVDLAIGPVEGDANLTYGALAQHNVAAGDPTRIEATFQGRSIHFWPDLFVGPYTEHGFVLQNDIRYNVTAHLDLARGDRVVRDCILYADAERNQVMASEAPVVAASEGGAGVAITLSGVGGAVLGAVATLLIRRR